MNSKEYELNQLYHAHTVAETLHEMSSALELDTFSVTTNEVCRALKEGASLITLLAGWVNILENKYAITVLVNDQEIRIDESIVDDLFNTVIRDWVVNAINSYAQATSHTHD